MPNLTEYYYYTYNQIFEGITEIDYIQLKNETYNSVNNNTILPIYDINNIKKGLFYGNKNVIQNIENKTINGTSFITLKTYKGILIFLNAPNSYFYKKNLKSISKPFFTSGFYLGKEIEIILEVLNDPQQTRQISVVFL